MRKTIVKNQDCPNESQKVVCHMCGLKQNKNIQIERGSSLFGQMDLYHMECIKCHKIIISFTLPSKKGLKNGN
jgi:hypothetical protein